MPSWLLLLFACAVVALASCRTATPAKPVQLSPVVARPQTNYVLITRNNSLSLLYKLLGDEKKVSKLLIIKRDNTELHDLIKRISSVAGVAIRSFDEMAKADPTMDLQLIDLPRGEVAARGAESRATAKELLHSSGNDFQFKLLLTQAQALGYAHHLAAAAAANEANAQRRTQLMQLSRRLEGLHGDVIRLLQRTVVDR